MNVRRHEPVAEAERTLRPGGWFGATAILAYLASFKLMLHLLTNGNYGLPGRASCHASTTESV
jgi:hypothetical protein